MSIEKNNIVVIGAGIGGLSAAAILSFAGFNVTILEQNKDVGGKAGVLKKMDMFLIQDQVC